MNCEEFEKHIVEYLTDDDLDPDLKEPMEIHYFDCDKCFKSLELMSATIGVIESEGVEKLLRYSDKRSRIPLVETFRKWKDILSRKLPDMSVPSKFPNMLVPVTFYSFESTRSTSQTVQHYRTGESVIVTVYIPSGFSGYLMILCTDENKDLIIVYPAKNSDETFVNGDDKKDCMFPVNLQAGKYTLATILTYKKVFHSESVSFENPDEINHELGNFLNRIGSLDIEKCRFNFSMFKVVS